MTARQADAADVATYLSPTAIDACLRSIEAATGYPVAGCMVDSGSGGRGQIAVLQRHPNAPDFGVILDDGDGSRRFFAARAPVDVLRDFGEDLDAMILAALDAAGVTTIRKAPRRLRRAVKVREVRPCLTA